MLITDGQVGNGDQVLKTLGKRLEGIRALLAKLGSGISHEERGIP